MIVSDKSLRDASIGELSLALAHYDRHLPLIEGSVRVLGFPVSVMEVGQNEEGRYGRHRHDRMLNGQEFDIAEVSLSSYLMAKDRNAPFTAIPVFPRRLFSLSQMWVRKDTGIVSVADLRGKRVGLNTFQTTLSVLAKADLGRMYGVDWRDITWVTQRSETIKLNGDSQVKVERLREGETLFDAMMNGVVDSIMIPHPTEAMLQNAEVVRLLGDARSEEARYFNSFGYFPIMHVVAVKAPLLDRHPELGIELIDAFERAKYLSEKRWDDPNWSMLAWGRQALEDQRVHLGNDIWPNGIARNRANLEWFIDQSFDQGLIGGRMAVDDLFHASVLRRS